jgi:hypothetical protein
MRNEITGILNGIEKLIPKIQRYLERDMSDERSERLENELDILEQVRDLLQELE